MTDKQTALILRVARDRAQLVSKRFAYQVGARLNNPKRAPLFTHPPFQKAAISALALEAVV